MEVLVLTIVLILLYFNRASIARLFRSSSDSQAVLEAPVRPAPPPPAPETAIRTGTPASPPKPREVTTSRRTMQDYDWTYSIMKDFLDAAGDRTGAEDFQQAMVNADNFVMNLSIPDRTHLLRWIDDYMKEPPSVPAFGEVRDNGADRFRAWLRENS